MQLPDSSKSNLSMLIRRTGALLSRPAKSAIARIEATIEGNVKITVVAFVTAAIAISAAVRSCPKMIPSYVTPPIHNEIINQIDLPLIKVFVSIPENKVDFHKVFGRSATKSDLVNLKKDLNATTKLSEAEYIRSRSIFLQSLKEEKSSIIVVVGHNEAGSLRFPDGSSADLSEIANVGVNDDKRYIFISCKAQKYTPTSHFGTASDLTYAEAISIAMDLQEFYQHPVKAQNFVLNPLDLEEVITNILKNSERSAKIAYNVKQIAKGGLPVAMAGGVVLISKSVAMGQLIPEVKKVTLKGVDLIVTGKNFNQDAAVLLDGKQITTNNDKEKPSTILICHSAAQSIAFKQTVKLKVQNPNGELSSEFSFTRPQ